MNQIRYRAGYRYQLAAPYECLLMLAPVYEIVTEWARFLPSGHLVISTGYAWDGPSGLALDTKSAMRGSLVHDALYQLIRLRLLPEQTRETVDHIYERFCIEDGMWKLRAWGHFTALRAFGWAAADPESERPVLTAP